MLQLHKSTSLSRLNKLHVVKDGTHNETWQHGGQQYWEAMRSFMEQSARQTSLYSAGRVVDDVNTSVRSSGNIKSGSIPLMPRNILNMAQEALRTSSAGDLGDPDKKEL